jgi:hypothetical protein
MAEGEQHGGNSRCPRCGRGFDCGLCDPSGCWCATEFPNTLHGEKDWKSCLCPDCLRKEIRSRAAT